MRTKEIPATRARFHVEKLEDRSMLAGLVASLSGAGVLTITGTSGNDTISLRQSGGTVSIDGVNSSFFTSRINSVVVNSGTGTDTVSLNGLVASGQKFAKSITVNAGAGLDNVKLLDGSYTYLSGSGALAVSTSGVTTVGGTALNWFDRNIQDAAIRGLARAASSDGAINRTEMLGIFRQVSADKSMSASEFADLAKIAATDSLFGSNDSVKVLTKDVVLGNAANKSYQGTALGNLTSASNTTQLDKLVSKWFLGTDHPLAKYGSTTFAYANASGKLFANNGPVYTDVKQGAVGDCYFVATLAEAALKNPNAVKSMFTVNGDGTYTVRFYNNGKADYVTVDSMLPVSNGRLIFANMGQSASSSSNVLWVAMAEKAYCQINEAGWLRQGLPGNGVNSYQAVAGGYFFQAVKQIANVTSVTASTSSITFAAVANAFAAGKMVGFASTSSPSLKSVVGNHQYVLTSVDSKAQTVTLFNPWGINNGSAPGLVTLTMTQLKANYSYWDRA